MSKFYFARYTITSGDQINDKFDFLLKGLINEGKVEHQNYMFSFFDTEVFEFNQNEYISGKLVKYNPDDIEKVVDEDTRKIRGEIVKNKVVGEARFIIDPKNSILMYADVPSIISKNNFENKFSALFEKNHNNFFIVFNIIPIKEKYSFLEQVKSLKHLKKITITLFPSNPNFSERWKKIDERLRNNNISKYRETLENTKDAMNLKVDEDTESKFLMSEDGYGVSTAHGITEKGELKTLSTSDKSKLVSIVLPPDMKQIIDILEYVSESLHEIIKRTKDEIK